MNLTPEDHRLHEDRRELGHRGADVERSARAAGQRLRHVRAQLQARVEHGLAPLAVEEPEASPSQ